MRRRLLLASAAFFLPASWISTASAAVPGAAWSIESNAAFTNLGRSVASAGDVNGDGYDDVAVGVPLYSAPEQSEGVAAVFHGSAAGLQATYAWAVGSNQDDAELGWSVASAGDVNGDGYDDVIVGAPGYTNGQYVEGRASVYTGSAAGLRAAAAWTGEANQAMASYGWSVASAGDVNGDGFDDVIVGAFDFDNGQTGEGRAFVYLGSAAGLRAAAAWTAEADQASARFGMAVASAGDVNGDGYDDVIVGAEWFDDGQSNEGEAFVYLGSAAGLRAAPAWTAQADQVDAHFGTAVAGAGDVNGDGYDDVIVGADGYDAGEAQEGRAFLYLGSAAGLQAAPAWTAESDQVDAYFGTAVAGAGDLNGDGYDDVAVGASWRDRGEADEGTVSVFLGGSAGLAAAPAVTLESNQAGAHFGGAVAGAGDVDGDGNADLVVGAETWSRPQNFEGGAFLFLGR